jgi:hypothetical protein
MIVQRTLALFHLKFLHLLSFNCFYISFFFNIGIIFTRVGTGSFLDIFVQTFLEKQIFQMLLL